MTIGLLAQQGEVQFRVHSSLRERREVRRR